MYEVIYWGDMPLHWPLAALCAVLCAGLYAFTARRKGLCRAALLHAALTAVLGLFLARAIYAAVCWYDLFLDEMGNFEGVGAFFDPTIGSMNVIGFLAGLLIAAPIAARLGKVNAVSLLDASVVPALTMYILARAIEPLTGQGYGDLMEMEVSVCWLEAALTAAVLVVCILFLHKKCRKPGTCFQYALTLWCLTQILPESLRCDEALFVLVFARVTHLGLAVTLGLTLIRLLIAGRWRQVRFLGNRSWGKTAPAGSAVKRLRLRIRTTTLAWAHVEDRTGRCCQRMCRKGAGNRPEAVATSRLGLNRRRRPGPVRIRCRERFLNQPRVRFRFHPHCCG